MALKMNLPVRGTSARQLVAGDGVPSDVNDGREGDAYIDLLNAVLYGPKADGAWPGSGTSLLGPAGWSPALSAEADGERRVLRVADFIGGAGNKPEAGSYIGPAGWSKPLQKPLM